jgi:heme ABC exporter ATP-binding subunit CcmA
MVNEQALGVPGVAQMSNSTTATKNNPDLHIKALKKSFGLKPVLRGIDLSLCSGERLALLGANGAGKTTLLRILAGLTKPTGGSFHLKGLDGVRDAQQIRRLVGFVAHQPYLYDELTALENLLFFAHMYTVKNIHERARELLRRVGLERRAQERVSALSRGQVQRLALARALLHAPWLLLLDEPHTSLDEEGSALLETLLTEHVEQGGGVLFTTHDLERALKLSHSIAILSDGRIVYHQPTQALELDGLREAYNRFTS